MRCQIPGCKKKGLKATVKDGVFFGVHLENVMIWTCADHSEEEITEALQNIGEEEASLLQHEANPFQEVKKFCKQS